jgi:hypothetical protein
MGSGGETSSGTKGKTLKTLWHFEQRTFEPDGLMSSSFRLKVVKHASQVTIILFASLLII